MTANRGLVYDPNALPDVCRNRGHVDGCPCRAGGDVARRRKRPVHARRPTHWVADRDGIAHARSHARSPRTACGLPAIDERFAWPPVRGRCGGCEVVLEAVVAEEGATA